MKKFNLVNLTILILILVFSTYNLKAQFQWQQIRKGQANLESLRDIRCIDSNDCYSLGEFMSGTSLLWTSNGGSFWKSTYWDKENYQNGMPLPYTSYRIAYPHKNHVFLAFEKGLLIKTNNNFKTRDSIFIKSTNLTKDYNKDLRFLFMKDSLLGIAGSNSFLSITKDGWKTFKDLTGFDGFVPVGYILSFGLFYGSQVYIIDSLNYVLHISCSKQIGEFEFIHKAGIAQTNDGGVTWRFYQLSDTKSNSDLDKYILNFYFLNRNIGWAIGEDSWDRSQIYKTIDGGLTWNVKYEDSLGVSTELLEIAFSDENNGMAVGKFGEVRVTYDGGETWINETFAKDYDTRMGRIVQHLAYTGKTAYISTFADGIWKGTFPTTSVDENNVNGGMISPNPASDFIEISIPDIDTHTLKGVVENGVQIFNTLGIEVGLSSLIDDKNRIDISNFPFGVYFIKIGDRVEKFLKI
jgi:hypothetical protein